MTIGKTLRGVVKRLVPLSIRRSLGLRRLEALAFRYDRAHFSANRMRSLVGATPTQLEAKLTFHSHSLEKGLSHEAIRYQFGERALKELSRTIREYDRQGLDRDRMPYVNALSTIKAYIEVHDRAGQSVEHLDSLLGDLVGHARETPSDLGGVITVNATSERPRNEKVFDEFFVGRSSIRHFSSEDLDLAAVRNAISLATKAPSVCNRQATRVKVITDPTKIRDVLELQEGMTGYGLPPGLLVVTTDQSAFLSYTERNQGFIDGGLFAMALMLSLEFYDLAACPLNAMFPVRREIAINDAIDLMDSERILMFIAVGGFPDEAKVPKSFRFPGDEITEYSL